MSKLAEMIERNCLLVNSVKQGGYCFTHEDVWLILESLRPYIELGELVANSTGAYVLNTQEERKQADFLLEQIKQERGK